MKIRFEIRQFKANKVNVSEYSSVSEFKECFSVLLDEEMYLPEFDHAGLMFFDDNGVLISEISLVRVPSSNCQYDIAVSVLVDNKTVSVSRYNQNVFHFWHYLNEVLSD